MWLQFLSVLSILFFLIIFDFGFTDESSFIFDPDADNWRRKVVRGVVLSGVDMFLGVFGSYRVVGRTTESSSLLCVVPCLTKLYQFYHIFLQEASR